MDTLKAQRKMTELIADARNFWITRIKKETDLEMVPQTVTKEYEALRNKIKKFSTVLAAHPDFQDKIASWMIDVRGKGDIDFLSEKDVMRIMESSNVDEKMRELINQSGGLAQSMQNFIESNGFCITDRSCGSGTWHLGILCNDKNANKLCTMLHKTFEAAIDRGLVTIYKKFWGHNFLDYVY